MLWLGAMGVAAADTAELEFVRHRALVEREGMRRARAALKRRSDALRDTRHSAEPPRAPSVCTHWVLLAHCLHSVICTTGYCLRTKLYTTVYL